MRADMKERGKNGNGNGNGNGHSNKIATVTFLDQHQIEFLDKLDRNYYFHNGHSLPRGKILSELVSCLMHLGIDIGEMDPKKETFCEFLQRKLKNEERVHV